MHLTRLRGQGRISPTSHDKWRIAAGIIPLNAEPVTGIGLSAPVMAADARPVKVRESAMSPAFSGTHAAHHTADRTAPWGDEARLGGPRREPRGELQGQKCAPCTVREIGF
jgi:hypothetical protein